MQPDSIRVMGDKSTARDTMKNAGVPTVPGSDGLLKVQFTKIFLELLVVFLYVLWFSNIWLCLIVTTYRAQKKALRLLMKLVSLL